MKVSKADNRSYILHEKYDPGGGSNTLVFLQKVATLVAENEKMDIAMKMLKAVEPDIPIYHTRAMRRKFQQEVKLLSSPTPPHVLRHIYKSLTGDTSAELTCQEIDERVQLAIETEDPDLIIDMRHLNKGRPGNTFEVFFTELEAIVEELTAADDRRHGVAHMSQFLSISDLIKQVKERVPEGTNIPSESTVIHAFAPRNMHRKTAQYYTGRIKLKHTVQRRQLRAYHSDSHWCASLYRYLREMAILNRDPCVFISCDDKAKIDFGEPGSAVSTGVRGRKSLVPSTSMLGALDHDVNQKGVTKLILNNSICFFSLFLLYNS
ncbi:uncharacterized protein [Clytia hemisphaerica]|uniref:Uncharacterized protein n=1 Tax=Clytia hemisphaerica TaxID=252671 RepID=A0A7M5XL96_9CNID